MSKEPGVRAKLAKPIPSIVGRIAVAIVLGGATTVGVSWILALLVAGLPTMSPGRFSVATAAQVMPNPPNTTGTSFLCVMRFRRWGTEIIHIRRQGPGWPAGSVQELIEGTSYVVQMKEEFKRGRETVVWRRADGWPLPAFSVEARWRGRDPQHMWELIGGVRVDDSSNLSIADGGHFLPLRPIWSGIVVDSLLYTLLYFGLLSLPHIGRWRQLRRRRRGQCERCGYTLQSEQDRCSECGKPVSK